MKINPVLFTIIFIFFINPIIAQERQKSAIVFECGYPIVSGFEINNLEKNTKLLFFGMGYDWYMSENVFYTLGLSAYNMYYKVFRPPNFIGGLDGHFLMNSIKPSVTVYTEIKLFKRKILNIGLGVNGRFDVATYLDEETNGYKRTSFYGGGIGIHSKCKYYFGRNDKSRLGTLIEGNYYIGSRLFDFGIGLSYKLNFK